MRKMFIESIKSGFRQFNQLSGRATRAQYWYWQLFTALVSIATTFMDVFLVTMFPGSKFLSLSLVGLIILYLPSIAVTVRRFHDINRSGWWLLVIMIINVYSYSYWSVSGQWYWLIPLAGSLSTLISWSCRKSDPAANRYGDNPFKKTSFVA